MWLLSLIKDNNHIAIASWIVMLYYISNYNRSVFENHYYPEQNVKMSVCVDSIQILATM